MPLHLKHRHQTLQARPSRRGCLACLHVFIKGVYQTLYQHPEQNVSWPSLPLLEVPRRPHPKHTHLRSISESQLYTQPWEDVRHTSHHFAHARTRAPPHANFGVDALLELSNSVRESLARQGGFGPRADCMSFFLELALLEEREGVPTINFETIKVARLDKLVATLIECGQISDSLLPRYVHDVVTAEKLDHLWRTRFKLDYFMIDEIRTHDLTTRWQLDGRPVRLRSITLPTSLALQELGSTVARNVKANIRPGGYFSHDSLRPTLQLTDGTDGGRT
ncbi:hypothetical protein N657DRAFT_417763 [Parathielavia appendiculata]|uniref:Uncharacterized protein n=1 Tax=Parathielavia appendiculata TaxID=2587402 RepID=A0AAN6Z380_9PEZI|nr:hypothetical protein N657DRAFT_417763 [Parathielavia appendiculata]